MKIQNSLEAIAVSIQMASYQAMEMIRDGRYDDALKIMQQIEMSCFVAHKELEEHKQTQRPTFNPGDELP